MIFQLFKYIPPHNCFIDDIDTMILKMQRYTFFDILPHAPVKLSDILPYTPEKKINNPKQSHHLRVPK